MTNCEQNWRERAEYELAITRELRRRECRRSFLAFCEDALAPIGQAPAAHHRFFIQKLQDVADGKIPRLMLNLPPGSAKSTYASVLFPPWVMSRRAGFDLIGASNTSTLAENFSRRAMGVARDNAETLQYRLIRESAEQWETDHRGRYRATGIGGSIAGTRADGALIDDPTRSRADAESETVRESQWAWFTGDLRTRLKPDAWIIVIMTRWHMDDLGGRLIDRQPGLWEVISIPAQADSEDDPLGRDIGEWLWSDDQYGYGGELAKVKREYEAAGAMRDWAALYQQKPVMADGAIFKTGMIQIVDAIPAGTTFARAWDLAATAQTGTRDPDWTAGVKIGRCLDGRIIVADVKRERHGPDGVEALIYNTATQDGKAIRIGLPQDPGQAGKQQVLHLTRKLSGWRVDSSPESGDKATRAAPFASQVNVGNVLLLRGDWNAAYLDELASFPGGMKDDQVDASSRGFAMVSSNPPMRITPSSMARMARPPMVAGARP